MPSTISAGTTAGTAVAIAGDTTGNLAFQTNGTTTALTIDTSQNVGIGTTSPGQRLQISNTSSSGFAAIRMAANSRSYDVGVGGSASGFQQNNWYVYDVTGAATRMVIDSVGRVGIGVTPGFFFDARHDGSSGSSVTAYFTNTSTANNVANIFSVIPSQSFNTNSSHFAGQTAGTNTWLLYGNGTTSYSSDANLKKNIVTTRDGYINDVAKLRVVKYQWKANSDDSTVELGLIAQEVAEVFPGLVKDETAINPDGTKGATSKVILGSVFQPILIKCVQELNTMIKEQQAQIEELKAEIAALKGAQ